MWTNNLEMELWAEVPSVKVLAPVSSWTFHSPCIKEHISCG
jgi:hypothetical protein